MSTKLRRPPPRLNPALAGEAQAGLARAMPAGSAQPSRTLQATALALALHAALLTGVLQIRQPTPEALPDQPIEVTLETLPPPASEIATIEAAPEPEAAVTADPEPPPPPPPRAEAPPPTPAPVPMPSPVAPQTPSRPAPPPVRQTPRAKPPSLPASVRPQQPGRKPDGGERPSPEAAAPPANAAAPSASPAADAGGAWRGALAAWLQGHKTYPEAARRDGVEGRVVVRFTMDRGGTVTEVSLVRSSGFPMLDEAAAALLRGSRLPAPPAPAPDHLSITLPIRYSLAP